MRDKISIARVALLHPAVRQEVTDVITDLENKHFPKTVMIRVVQGYRTITEQNALYAKGRTTPGPKVTNAQGGSSYHNYGLAIDFALMYDTDGNDTYETLSWDVKKDFDADKIADWIEVVNAFKAKGWQWGGDFKSFKDYPHLQKPYGCSVTQLLSRYNASLFVPNTKYIKL